MRLRKIFLCGLLISIALPQPDNRFDIYDWVIYKQPGTIQSISEGYNYIYFGTENGGIWKFHRYRDTFEEPITKAQGLTSECIKAVFFDKDTGYLWAATEKGIEYSYSRDGNWYSHSFDEYILPSQTNIIQFGSSKNYVWAYTGTTFLKLDRTSGILLGTILAPDEEITQWSSQKYFFDFRVPTEWEHYLFAEGWVLSLNQLISPSGEYYQIITSLKESSGRIWIGSDNGRLFYGEKQMEMFYPLSIGPVTDDVVALVGKSPIHIAGRYNTNVKGISTLYPDRIEFDNKEYKTTLNMNPQSISSIIDMDEEIWYGSNQGILVYNKKQDFWRQLGQERGIPGLPVTSMSTDTSSVWIGTSKGISRLLTATKRSIPGEVEELLHDLYVNDIKVIGETIWIVSDYYLLIFDKANNQLIDFRNYGNTDSLGATKNLLKKFRKIHVLGDRIYITAENRVIKYSMTTKTWTLLFQPEAIPWDVNILSLAVSDEWCFIGTNKGLLRYDREYNLWDEYTFPFIGEVRDMVIRGKYLWLGTSNGLIKFNWKYDL